MFWQHLLDWLKFSIRCPGDLAICNFILQRVAESQDGVDTVGEPESCFFFFFSSFFCACTFFPLNSADLYLEKIFWLKWVFALHLNFFLLHIFLFYWLNCPVTSQTPQSPTEVTRLLYHAFGKKFARIMYVITRSNRVTACHISFFPKHLMWFMHTSTLGWLFHLCLFSEHDPVCHYLV